MKLNPFAIMREEIDGTGLVFSPDTNKVLTLNKSGVLLWNAIRNGDSKEKMVALLMEKFEPLTPVQAEKDIENFINDLKSKALIER